jgi:hypothetical protein
MMFERHSFKAKKRLGKKQLQKQRKASGNGEYNE